MGVFFNPAPQKKPREAPEKEDKARLAPGKSFGFGTEVSLISPLLHVVLILLTLGDGTSLVKPSARPLGPSSLRCVS